MVQHRQTLDRPLTVLNNHLASHDWLVGKRFTVADLNAASVMSWARHAQFDLAPYPNVAAWLKRCFARPAFDG